MSSGLGTDAKVKRILLAPVCLVLLAWGAGGPSVPTREQRELKMADDSIMASLVVSASPKGRYICAENRTACLGGDKAELGLDLIGARSTGASLAALADVIRYRTDGSLSEDYECYVLQKGRIIDHYLLKLKPFQLAERCNSELEKMIAVDRQWFEGLKPGAVCADEESIKAKIQSLRDTIRTGRKCSAGDF
jgi:hypothetical protein